MVQSLLQALTAGLPKGDRGECNMAHGWSLEKNGKEFPNAHAIDMWHKWMKVLPKGAQKYANIQSAGWGMKNQQNQPKGRFKDY